MPDGVEVPPNIENGSEWNLHHPSLWSYLVYLARAGRILRGPTVLWLFSHSVLIFLASSFSTGSAAALAF